MDLFGIMGYCVDKIEIKKNKMLKMISLVKI